MEKLAKKIKEPNDFVIKDNKEEEDKILLENILKHHEIEISENVIRELILWKKGMI